MDGLPAVQSCDVALGFALAGGRGARVPVSRLKQRQSLPASTCCLNFLYDCFPRVSCKKDAALSERRKA